MDEDNRVMLAVERSADAGGVALFRGGRRLAVSPLEAVTAAPKDSGATASARLAVIPEMLALAHVAPADIDRFVVGIGPGSFSGIRSAIAYLTGLAFPAGKTVEGYESPAVVATVLAARGLVRPAPEAPGQSTAKPNCVVVGDARRGTCWVAAFRVARSGDGGGTAVAATAPLSLVPYEGLAAALPPDAVVATPDWKRLADRLQACALGDRLVEGPALPTAEALAIRALCAAADAVPARPRYLHPAVAAPRQDV